MVITFQNGKKIPNNRCRVNLFNRALQFGEGLFETIYIHNHKLCFLEDHFDRLIASSNSFEFKISISKNEWMNEIKKESKSIPFRRGKVKIGLIPKGKPGDGLTALPTGFDRFSIWMSLPLKKKKDKLKIRLVDQSFRSNLHFHKMFQYALSAKEVRKANRLGYDDILFTYQNRIVLESSVANVFFVKGKKLFTPSLEYPLLPGITRKKILELAKKVGFTPLEKNISPKQLKNFDFCFLSNSTGGIHRVSELGPFKYGLVNDDLDQLDRAYSELLEKSKLKSN